MNIYLIPYSWARHLAVALVVAGAAVMAWWAVLAFILVVGPVAWRLGMYWPQGWEGGMYLGTVAATIAATSLYAEGSLRRRTFRWRFLFAAFAGGMAWFGAVFSIVVLAYLTPALLSDAMSEVVSDPSLVTLRYRLAMWLMAGLSSGAAAWIARMTHATLASRFGIGVDVGWKKRPLGLFEFAGSFYYHVGGGAVGGLLGGAVWHAFGFEKMLIDDLYLAGVAGPLVWGFLHGLLCWGIPDDLYAGWVRVLSYERYGLRIPLGAASGTVERFVGHFPRGLDLYLPVERGVAELHASFLASEDQRYSVRGLSIQPTVVKRPLEKIDLRYDTRRPAPFETELRMEDRIRLGDKGETVLEFLLLPREEQ